MSDVNDGGPAFPCEIGECFPGQNEHQNGPSTAIQYGMSLRDYFAAQALQSIFNSALEKNTEGKLVAEGCYGMADAMIKARSKP